MDKRRQDGIERRKRARERRTPRMRAIVSDALGACRIELEEHLALGDSVERFRGSVSAFAALARDEGVPPERALAVFKAMVSKLPVFERSQVHERGEMLRQLAHMEIESFYAGRDGRRDG